MPLSFEGKLTQEALRLKSLDREVVKAVVEWNPELLGNLLKEFLDLKKSIKLNMFDASVIKINDKVAQAVLQKVSLEQKFKTDEVLQVMSGEKISDFDWADLSDDELIDLGHEHFHSWFGTYEYIKALFEIGALIVGVSVPQEIHQYVSEARNCYAFQQYHALYAICRTILEAGVRHRCKTHGRLRRFSGNVVDFDAYAPRKLIQIAASGALRDRINDLYTMTSGVIHGRRKADDPKQVLLSTLQAAHELWS